MRLRGGTLSVSQTLPPIDEPRADDDAAEDRGAGVDHDVVFDDGMARIVLAQVPVAASISKLFAPSVTA